MKNFIENVLALFREKYDDKKDEAKTHFIDLPPDIKPSKIVVETEVDSDVANHNNFTNPSTQNRYAKQSKTSRYRDEHLDDVGELATFVISSNKQKHDTTSSNRKLGRWVSRYESLKIQGRIIDKGFFYFGGKLETLIGYGTEPSLINDSLSVGSPKVIYNTSHIYSDESLGYWPSYEALSPSCRGVYLDWLASGRANPNTPIGYVFIYFGGFERRVIEGISDDSVSNDEFVNIYNEVLRLHDIYGKQSSFSNYSANFLEFMTLVRSPLFEEKIQTAQLLPPPASSQNLTFKMQLAKRVTLKLPITATLAWEWLIFSNEYNFKTPARRCESEFSDLFELLYQKAYPNGFIVPPNKTKLKISYHAASQSIVSVDLTLDDLQDPSALRSPIKKLIAIAEQCNEALDVYSRYLGREGNSETDIDAIMLLPKALIQQQAYQEKYAVIQNFKAWAESVTQNDEGLTTVKELWRYLDERSSHTMPKSFAKKHSEMITNLAELAGFGVVPDQRYHQASLKPDGYVVLFDGGHSQDFEPSTSFYQISLALRLGTMVATINGYVDKREVDTLLTIIEQDTQLTAIEKASLKAYLLWRLNSPSNMAGLKANLAVLDEKHISFISRFIISVALANGNIEPSQIKQIEKLYQALGLDKNSVVSDIHHLTSAKKSMPTFSDATQQKTSDNSTGANANVSDRKSKPYIFNAELLAAYESETGDAKAMLASIFAADDDDMEMDNELLSDEQINNDTEADRAKESVAKGLDTIHSKLYQQLISKEVWQREEAEVLCESLNLMINGAIETINDWSYDNVDAPVLEAEDEIVIDYEIVEELKVLD
ncbi:TerB N-terminal domain-containing protein [Psychrobacter sp.]|uniref:tellurite resistance TerB family protein n=1 Tax=Psychrobacter sp. TaxID=56811 RepID=UPI003C7654CB|tara:strand:- start:7 stop:2487 length:2481 start_codon:yes stop_codon:yes gene_type:complete